MIASGARTAIRNRQEANFDRAIGEILSGNLLTLVDVGAAVDIEPRWRRVAGHLNYVGFEPDGRSRESLLKSQHGCASYTIFETALCERRRSLALNLCRKPTVSSSLEPNAEWLARFPAPERFDVLDRVELPADSMDSLGLESVDFVKVDVQGGELAVLQGAASTLRDVLGLEIEVEFLALYRDQPLFGDICGFLFERGFEFVDFVSINRWGRFELDGYGQAAFGDALFLRTPEQIAQRGLGAGETLRYVAICALYSRFDLIRRLRQSSGSAFPEPVKASIEKLEARFTKAKRRVARFQKAAALNWGSEFQLHLLH